jgi:hypothetical protein
MHFKKDVNYSNTPTCFGIISHPKGYHLITTKVLRNIIYFYKNKKNKMAVRTKIFTSVTKLICINCSFLFVLFDQVRVYMADSGSRAM